MRSWTAPNLPSVTGSSAAVHLFDTATGAVQRSPLRSDQGTARLYVCGITPYDATHLGHAATYVTFDTIGRLWRDAGLRVTFVQNITDVDEPLLERAQRDGIAWQDLAAREIDLFREDMEALRVLPPEHYIGAVEGIPDDVEAVRRLLTDGLAYRIPVEQVESGGTTGDPTSEPPSDIYLDLAQVPSFGSVSGWSRQQMAEVFADRGGDPERAGKRDPFDPLLWRAERPGEPAWDGGPDLGRGRPGWHIECSTIALRYLGPSFDVQGGGTDLIFPHHEMSASQAGALTGQPFADSYVHQAMVGLDGEKMSKSKGNLVLVSALRRSGTNPMSIRLLLLGQHYRTAWDYTDALLDQAEQRRSAWLGLVDAGTSDSPVSPDSSHTERAETVVVALRRALADDLDTPTALSVVDAAVRDATAPDSGWTHAERAMLLDAVDALLGVDLVPAST